MPDTTNNENETETLSPYALRVTVHLPTGPRTYDLFPRETAGERADSLAQFELLDDLIASVEDDDESAIRSLLSAEATGSEVGYEIEVTQENYLVLCAIIDHILTESDQGLDPEASQEETPIAATESTQPVESVITTKVKESGKGKFIKRINETEKLLGIETSSKKTLKEMPRKDLKKLNKELHEKLRSVMTGVLSGKTSTAESSTETETETTIAEPDTTVAEVAQDLLSPLLSSEPAAVEQDATKPADLETLRKAAGSLLNSEFRKSLRRGGR